MFKTQPVFMTVSLCCGLAFALPANAQDQTFLSQEEALRGLETVGVTVAEVTEDARQDGLSQQRLRTVTELTLRSAGISVQSVDTLTNQFLQNPRFRVAYLYVEVNTLRVGDGHYAHCVVVRMIELVKLVDDSGFTEGTIWSTGTVGMTERDKLSVIVDYVRESVEQFANDYLAANPRNR